MVPLVTYILLKTPSCQNSDSNSEVLTPYPVTGLTFEERLFVILRDMYGEVVVIRKVPIFTEDTAVGPSRLLVCPVLLLVLGQLFSLVISKHFLAQGTLEGCVGKVGNFQMLENIKTKQEDMTSTRQSQYLLYLIQLPGSNEGLFTDVTENTRLRSLVNFLYMIVVARGAPKLPVLFLPKPTVFVLAVEGFGVPFMLSIDVCPHLHIRSVRVATTLFEGTDQFIRSSIAFIVTPLFLPLRLPSLQTFIRGRIQVAGFILGAPNI
jgi:hypothetical protein